MTFRAHAALKVDHSAPLLLAGLLAGAVSVRAQPLYDFGNPTAAEQLQIELINRARMNPAAEGQRLANTDDPHVLFPYADVPVDLGQMQYEFSTGVDPVPPLAPNAHLTQAARGHSDWMLANARDTSYPSDPPSDPWERITAAGYGDYTAADENVFASARNGWHAHAKFEVNWGVKNNPYLEGGMEFGREHRSRIHNPLFREIGVGVSFGSNTRTETIQTSNGTLVITESVGPQIITQDFGARFAPPLATGVAYYDLNGNDFYDIGEGISGLTTKVGGASFSCLTAEGGGWTIPVPDETAERTVTFQGPGILQSAPISITAGANAKVDLKLPYSPPSFESGETALPGSPHTVVFTSVPAATLYRCELWSPAPAAAWDCDSAQRITTQLSGGYGVLNTAVKHSGTAAFWLANNDGEDQWIELDPVFHAGEFPRITFFSRIRQSSSWERFILQVRETDAAEWIDLDTQSGTGTSGEESFSERFVHFPILSGKNFKVRFLLKSSGSYFEGHENDDRYGWFVDSISFDNCEELTPSSTDLTSGPEVDVYPEEGANVVSVTPLVNGAPFPAGYQRITVSSGTGGGGFETWAAVWENTGTLAPGTIASPLDDWDGDGRCHLLEYAFGMSPLDPHDDTSRMPSFSVFANSFQITYQRDGALDDVLVEACVTTDGTAWHAAGEPGAPESFVDSTVATDGTLETRRAAFPMSSSDKALMRVRVSRVETAEPP